jgi:hypothetical protein
MLFSLAVATSSVRNRIQTMRAQVGTFTLKFIPVLVGVMRSMLNPFHTVVAYVVVFQAGRVPAVFSLLRIPVLFAHASNGFSNTCDRPKMG